MNLRLFSRTENKVRSLKCEIQDGAFFLINELKWTNKIEEAFIETDIAILLNSIPRGSVT
jgi:hypothetical protein